MNKKASSEKFVKYFFIALSFIVYIAVTGCGSSNGPDDSGENQLENFNSALYGAYKIDLTVAACSEESKTVSIGDDSSLTGLKDYLYLPANQNKYSDSRVTVERKDNTLIINMIFDDAKDTYKVTFNDEFSEGVISGSRTSDNPDSCTGTISGTIQLITRNPVKISSSYLQFRSYTNPNTNHRAAWSGLTKNGEPIAPESVRDIRLFKLTDNDDIQLGQALSPSDFEKGEYLEGTFDKSAGHVVFNMRNSVWSGIGFRPDEVLTQGDYLFIARVFEDDLEYTVSRKVSYPGDSSSPVATGLSSQWTGDGLVLSWIEPEGEYSGLSVDLINTDMDKHHDILLSVAVAREDNVSSVTIPLEQMEAIKYFPQRDNFYGSIAFQVKTNRKNDDGMTYACGISNPNAVPDSPTWKNVDNRQFYGAYTIEKTEGECVAQSSSIIIGKDISKAGLDDYLYLPEYTLSHTLGGLTFSRTGKNILTLSRNQGERTEVIHFTFTDNRNSADLSGFVSGSTECDGQITGQLNMITREPVTVDFCSITSQTTAAGATPWKAFIALKKGGIPVDASDLVSFEMKGPDSSLVFSSNINNGIFESQNTLMGEYHGEDIINRSSVSWAGMVYTSTYPQINQGEYTLTAYVTVASSIYSISQIVQFPQIAAPAPRIITGRTARLNPDGTMSFGWTLPEEEFDELYVSIIKKSDNPESEDYLLTVKVNPDDLISHVVVPKDMVDSALNDHMPLTEGEELRMELQARKYSESGMNYSSGLTTLLISGITSKKK